MCDCGPWRKTTANVITANDDTKLPSPWQDTSVWSWFHAKLNSCCSWYLVMLSNWQIWFSRERTLVWALRDKRLFMANFQRDFLTQQQSININSASSLQQINIINFQWTLIDLDKQTYWTKKECTCIALHGKATSDITCRKAHTVFVTWHQMQVNVPHLNHSQVTWYSITYPRWLEGWVELGGLLHIKVVYQSAEGHPSKY